MLIVVASAPLSISASVVLTCNLRSVRSRSLRARSEALAALSFDVLPSGGGAWNTAALKTSSSSVGSSFTPSRATFFANGARS